MVNNIWIFLGVIVAILLVVYWNRQNAIWVGLTLGIIVGLIAAIFFAFKGRGFDWYLIGKIVIVGTLLGFIAELMGKLSDYLKRKT